jgi:lysophospholipase L1-like esterase
MSATNGSTSRRGLMVCVLAVAFALSAVFASSAGAAAPVKERYLALGDSLAFGYSKQLANENEKAGEPPSAYEHGYANYYMNKLKWKANGIQLVNNGCPGETTGGLIGTGPLGAGLAAGAGAEPEAMCEYHNLAGLPLHHEYGAGKSQLENALETIAVAAGEGKPVTTVSLNIGANDELHAVAKCESEAKGPAEAAYIKAFTEALGKGQTTAEADAAGKAAAKKAGLEFVENCLKEKAKALFTHIATNIGATLFAIREGSKFGGVNYGGKIILLGDYDPYGNVFGTGELLNNSTALASILNTIKEKEVAPKFGACFANPFPRFNPLNKAEPGRLQTLTNMANFTEFEGKKNGPDIHPTVTGYKVLAQFMFIQCP